ncbi:MAG: ABC transporter ATP-binding protein [Thermosphaera sp.]
MLAVEELTVAFDRVPIIEDISFRLEKGEIAVLMGPNASGKTTLIKAIAGLVSPLKGRVILENNLVFKADGSSGRAIVNIPPHLRQIGYVPSDYALFDHLTVRDNVMLGLAKKPLSKHEKEEKVRSILELMNLEKYSNTKPPALSSGLKQKVALARALVTEPKLLLLDEPFSSIDPASKPLLRLDLKKLLNSYRITTIIATHDVEDAFWFRGRVLVLTGRMITHNSPFLSDDTVEDEYLAKSLGFNVLEGRIVRNVEPGKYLVEVGESLVLAKTNSIGRKLVEGGLVNIVFPPNGLRLTPECQESIKVNALKAYLLDAVEKFGQVTLVLEVGSLKVRADVSRGEWEKLRGEVSKNCLTILLPENSISVIEKYKSNGDVDA